jgi:hypothetical protein
MKNPGHQNKSIVYVLKGKTSSSAGWVDLQEAEYGSEDTRETNGGGVDPDVTRLGLLAAGRAAAGGRGAGVAWGSEGARALVLALDDVGGAVLAIEDFAGVADVLGGLDVEGAAVVLESWERDPSYVTIIG